MDCGRELIADFSHISGLKMFGLSRYYTATRLGLAVAKSAAGKRARRSLGSYTVPPQSLRDAPVIDQCADCGRPSIELTEHPLDQHDADDIKKLCPACGHKHHADDPRGWGLHARLKSRIVEAISEGHSLRFDYQIKTGSVERYWLAPMSVEPSIEGTGDERVWINGTVAGSGDSKSFRLDRMERLFVVCK